LSTSFRSSRRPARRVSDTPGPTASRNGPPS